MQIIMDERKGCNQEPTTWEFHSIANLHNVQNNHFTSLANAMPWKSWSKEHQKMILIWTQNTDRLYEL
jgi:hypothetical protein